MNDISLVAAAGASVIIGLILWWAIGRHYQSWLKKGLVVVGAILLGYVVYFLLAIILTITGAVLHPQLAHETGVALGQGFKTLPMMLMIVVITVLSLCRRSGSN